MSKLSHIPSKSFTLIVTLKKKIYVHIDTLKVGGSLLLLEIELLVGAADCSLNPDRPIQSQSPRLLVNLKFPIIMRQISKQMCKCVCMELVYPHQLHVQ